MNTGSNNKMYRDELSKKFDLVDVSAFLKIGDKYSDIKITYYTTPISEKFTIYFPEREGWAIERRVVYEYIYDPTFPEKGHWLINHIRNTGLRNNFGKLSQTDDVNKVLKHFKQTASAARSLKKIIDREVQSKESLDERKLTKAELDKREDIIKDMKGNKRSLVKRYGKDAEKVMYGRATNMAKKKTDENMDQKAKIREMVKTALSTPQTTTEEFTDKHDENPALKGSQKDLPDALQKSIIDKSVKEEEEPVTEDLDLGHEDNEPGMLKSDLYKIGQYAMELYQIMDKLDDGNEVDLPHWWQAKVIKSKDALVSAKHFLDFELKEPQIDQVTDMVDAKGQKYAIDESIEGTPSQDEVDTFFSETQQELHYLASKPVEEWDEYDMSNWRAKLKKKELGRPQVSEIIKDVVKEFRLTPYDYKSFESSKNIKYQDMNISSGYWSYTGQERFGKGVYKNVDNDQEYMFSPDDIEYFKKHLGDIEVVSEMIPGIHSVMGDKSKKKKRPSKKDIKLAKDTQADYEKSKEEEEDYEGLAARSGASLEETDYKVAGRKVKVIKGKKSDGTDWKVELNGKEVDLSDVLALIEPKPKLTKESTTSTIAEKLAKKLKKLK